jgi:hypothetical protein
MPEHGSLFRRLRTDLRLCALYAYLLHQPCGPYDTHRLSSEELNETLDHAAGKEVFGSRAVVDRTMTDLQAELRQAAVASPGLERRAAYLKMHDEFERTLAGQLSRLGHPDAGSFAHTLLDGAGPVGPESFGHYSRALELVPAPVVAEGARWLQQISPDVFDWLAEDFQQWRQTYLEAAERGEAIVIGCG